MCASRVGCCAAPTGGGDALPDGVAAELEPPAVATAAEEQLSAEEQEPIFATWTCDETAAWVRGGQAPAKLLGAYSIGPVTGCDRAGH